MHIVTDNGHKHTFEMEGKNGYSRERRYICTVRDCWQSAIVVCRRCAGGLCVKHVPDAPLGHQRKDPR
jgi:hypothetical protein